MTDEAFYLTPLDVRRKQFESAMRGYKKEHVDDYLQQVADELERLSRANTELDAKARGFHEQLRAFRERDKALNDALISAQQLRSEIREQAEREAQLILREAKADAERMLDNARKQVGMLEDELAALGRLRRSYLAGMRAMIERQLAEVQAQESAVPATTLPGHEERRAEKATPAWLDPVAKE